MIGSNTIVEVSGKKVRGRLYPWGIVEGKVKKWVEAGKIGRISAVKIGWMDACMHGTGGQMYVQKDRLERWSEEVYKAGAVL